MAVARWRARCLIDTMRSIERTVSPAQRAEMRFLLISIDPDRDTVANLNALASSRKLDTSSLDTGPH